MVLQSVAIVVVLLLAWGRALISPIPMEAGSHPAVLYELLCTWLQDVPRLTVVIAMLLVLVEGIFLNLILVNVGLCPQNSLLPTLIYVLCCSAGAHTLTPLLLVNGAMIGCLHYLMLRGTLLTISASHICNATALIGLATLFYVPAIGYLVAYMLVATGFKLYGWRDWTLMLLGFAIPYVPLLSVQYLAGNIEPWWQQTVEAFSTFGIALGSTTLLGIIGALLLGMLMIWGLVGTIVRLSENTVLWRTNATTLILMTVGSVGLCFFMPLLPTTGACVAIPFAFCGTRQVLSYQPSMSQYGTRRKRGWMADVMVVLILIATFIC